MDVLRKVGKWLVPGKQAHDEQEREAWPSRLSFLLAALGGAVGVGNLIRYPSIALRNFGIQWFIPYFTALLIIGLPILSLEISIGQAYRSGNVVAFGRISKRLRGVGLSAVFLGYIAATYYVLIMSWVMTYFRYSFQRPLPWFNDNVAFFREMVHRNPKPIVDATRQAFTQYPATAVLWETVGWTLLTWLLVYLCIFRGVSLTGKIVYVTMLVPFVTCIAILIRAVTLENAINGIKLYVGQWHGHKLLSGDIWKDAIIQIFFSVGTGFGIYVAYASYNPRSANAVQDVVIVACGNSMIEVCAAFAAFGVVGFLGIDPTDKNLDLSTFSVGFVTYPTALARLPGANAWAVVFFFTLYLLGIDSAFAYLEGFTTAVLDSDGGKKIRKSVSVALIVLSAALISLMYTNQIGFYLLEAMDTQVTGIALMFSTWMECVGATSLYRYKDVVSQTGWKAYLVAQSSYIGSMVMGVILATAVHPLAGIGAFLFILIAGTAVAVAISEDPEVVSPAFGSQIPILNRLWWLTCYPGHQLSKDLNAIVARGKNWGLPVFWAPVLRWVAAPTLITILSIGYASFYKNRKDPLHIFAFIFAHVFIICIVIGVIIPQSFSIWVSQEDLDSDAKQYRTSPGATIPVEFEDPLVDDEEADGEKLVEKSDKDNSEASTST